MGDVGGLMVERQTNPPRTALPSRPSPGTIMAMDSRRLKLSQIAQLQAAIGKQLTYVNKVCTRMKDLEFPADDPVQREAMRAEAALQNLFDVVQRLRQLGRRTRGQPPWE